MTMKRNPKNERAKRRYLQFLRDSKGRDEASIDGAAKALERFDEYNRYRDFQKFHIEQARAFKNHLLEQRNIRTDKPLSASTIAGTLAAVKAFFIWLAGEPGYRSRIRYADAEYFNPPEKLSRVASAHRAKRFASLDQIREVIRAMPAGTEIERRDRAVVAFTILTGARDKAIVSFKLKHIDTERGLVEQDAREVHTKRAKTFTTWFFPVGDDIRDVVVDWVKYLHQEKGFGPDDPLFPKTKVAPGPNHAFCAKGLDRAHWANAAPVRAIFREAFERAGLAYVNPHSCRDTLVHLAYARNLGPEQFKVWSQNLGHEHVLTTFCSYGSIPRTRQAEIMRALADPATPNGVASNEILSRIKELLDKAG